MKLTPKAFAPLALAAAFGLGTLAPHAQTPATKVGFVDVNALFAAHPADKDIKALQASANKELTELENKAKAIQAKGANATAAEKQQLEQLATTYNAKLKKFDEQMSAKAKPVETSIDNAISSYAKQNGYAIIMDRTIAAQSNLVIYADPATTDLTAAVKKNIK